MDLAALARQAAGLVRPGRRVVLGVAGVPGAGKSTFAAALVEQLNAGPPPLTAADRHRLASAELRDEAGQRPGAVTAAHGHGCPGGDWAALLPMDGFHLPQVRLVELGLRERMGAPETFDGAAYARVVEQVTRSDKPVSAPAFDRTVEEPRPGGLRIGSGHRLVVTEGSYLLLPSRPWLSARLHLAEVWYLRLDEPTRAERLVTRHVQFGKSPQAAAAWVARVDGPNARLVERYADAADLVVVLA